MSELLNISDQLEAYTEENIDIVKKLAKSENITIEQALKATEIATKEMIADCLFHMNKKLDDIGDNISSLYFFNELESISNSLDGIANELANTNDREKENRKEDLI